MAHKHHLPKNIPQFVYDGGSLMRPDSGALIENVPIHDNSGDPYQAVEIVTFRDGCFDEFGEWRPEVMRAILNLFGRR